MRINGKASSMRILLQHFSAYLEFAIWSSLADGQADYKFLLTEPPYKLLADYKHYQRSLSGKDANVLG
jgi:hypothetical protein